MKKLGVCGWSLEPRDCGGLVSSVQECGISNIQLALEPFVSGQWDVDQALELFHAKFILPCSGMMGTVGEDYSTLESIQRTGGIRPDEHWELNISRAIQHASSAHKLGIHLVTFHAGFIPNASSSEYQKIIDRIEKIANIFGEQEVVLGLETGQEGPEIMLDLLDRPALSHVGVNFDPANMILYGSGNPANAFDMLKDRVVQVHIKDALAASDPNDWGKEVPVGCGDVDWDHFFRMIHTLDDQVNVVIEREAGSDRVRDIIKARELALANGMIS